MMAKKQMAENAATDPENSDKDQDADSCQAETVAAEITPEGKIREIAGNQAIVGARDSSEYSCPRCGNAYLRLHSLNRHIKFECGVEPRFECPVCHKKSKHKHNLILHMRTHQKS
ncbi:longitudinals lacking protein, isoforms A/B/D/L [Megalopta genalis]|uniref:longitudinals lacking protein, isoforms A/B/D/L n=1 Tax=Megalopta genalis TaxID=115081 RepID=UPI003FD522D5